MTETRTSQPPQESNAGGPFEDFQFPNPDDEYGSSFNRTPDRSGTGSDQDASSFIILKMDTSDSEVVRNMGSGKTDAFVQRIISDFQQSEQISEIKTNVSQNSERISTLTEDMNQLDSVNKQLTQIQRQTEELVSSEQLDEKVENETSKQINERIVAPLLFGTALVLLLASLGALLTGGWPVLFVTAPVLALTAYYMWKSRKV